MTDRTGCPYPQYIVDEVSGVRVENDLYRAWMEGYNRGYQDGQVKDYRDAIKRHNLRWLEKERREAEIRGRKGNTNGG